MREGSIAAIAGGLGVQDGGSAQLSLEVVDLVASDEEHILDGRAAGGTGAAAAGAGGPGADGPGADGPGACSWELPAAAGVSESPAAPQPRGDCPARAPGELAERPAPEPRPKDRAVLEPASPASPARRAACVPPARLKCQPTPRAAAAAASAAGMEESASCDEQLHPLGLLDPVMQLISSDEEDAFAGAAPAWAAASAVAGVGSAGDAVRQSGRRQRSLEAFFRPLKAARLVVEASDPKSPALEAQCSKVSAPLAWCCLTDGSLGGSRWYSVREIPGLYLLTDFLSEPEEAALTSWLDVGSQEWRHSSFNGECRSKNWGARTDLLHRRVRPADASLGEQDMPQELLSLAARLRDCVAGSRVPPSVPQPLVAAIKDFHPNEANANEYVRARGDSLTPHFDDRFLSGTLLVGLSLVGDCVMTYHEHPSARRGRSGCEGCCACGPRQGRAAARLPPGPGRRVLLPRRSVQVVTGKSRFEFTHSIHGGDLPASGRRLSVVLRQAKCPWP